MLFYLFIYFTYLFICTQYIFVVVRVVGNIYAEKYTKYFTDGIDLELTVPKSDIYSTGLLWCKRGNTFVYYISECRWFRVSFNLIITI